MAQQFSEALNNELCLISAAPLSLQKWKLHNGFLNQCCIYSCNLNLFIFWLGSVIVHLFPLFSSPFLLPLLIYSFHASTWLSNCLCALAFQSFWVLTFCHDNENSANQNAPVWLLVAFCVIATFAWYRFVTYRIAMRSGRISIYVWHFCNFSNSLYALLTAVYVW